MLKIRRKITLQIWVHWLVHTLQDFDQVTSGSRVGVGEEGNGSTFLSSTAGSTNSMDVIFNVVGEIKVDHKFDVLDVC